jgi:hypothetical protein
LGAHGQMDRRLATSRDAVRSDAALLNDLWYVLAAGRLLLSTVKAAEAANYALRSALEDELGM